MEMEMDFFKVNDAKYKNQVSNILLFEPHLVTILTKMVVKT